MSGHNAARTLPPGDRDEAPSFDLGPALRDTPLAPLPPLTNETDARRIARFSRALCDANKHWFEFMRALAMDDPAARDAAIDHCIESIDEAAPLPRLLKKFFRERITTTKE